MSSLHCLQTNGFIEVILLSVDVVEEEARWLLKMQLENLDLRKPKSLKKLILYLNKNPGSLLEIMPVLSDSLTCKGLTIIELHTVVIDPQCRGGGIHTKVYSAWKDEADPILHTNLLMKT